MIKPKWKVIGMQLVVLFIIFKIWSSYPVQDFIVHTIPIASDFFTPFTKMMPNWLLVQYLDDGNFYLRGSALQELCNRGVQASSYFEAIIKLTNHKRSDVRQGAYSLLKCLDKQRAIEFYFDELSKLSKTSPEYKQCLRILRHYKLPQLLPYLIEYASRSEGWRNASADYLAEYGDPAALSVLYEQRKKAEEEKLRGDWQGKYELPRINKAIDTLEAIKAEQEKTSKS